MVISDSSNTLNYTNRLQDNFKETIMIRSLLIVILFFGFTFAEAQDESRIIRYPNSSDTEITFCHGGDIFTVPIAGGLARRITSSVGEEIYPRFSNDGKTIAFSGEYDGNREIYTVASFGGEPKRLTYSMDIPGLPARMGPNKIIMQWTNNNDILYRSRHESWHAWTGQLFLINSNGGLPSKIDLPVAGYSSLSPDENKIAYNRVFREYRTWKRYRGGQADDIWIYDFISKKLDNITNDPAQDIIPMWAGNKIYFLSDRNKTMNLYCYDLNTKQTKQITNYTDYDIKFPSLGAKHIAFEKGGYLYLMDLATESISKITVQIQEDWPSIREKISQVHKNISTFDLSPDAEFALFSSRGDIFTYNIETKIIKNITNSNAYHDRDPIWSPNGEWISYISDKSGEFEIHLVKPNGSEDKQLTNNAESYRYGMKWSPDSKYILSSDKSMKLYYIDILSQEKTVIHRSDFWEIRDFSWSPDSRWITYVDYVSNFMPVIFIYSVDEKKSYQITDEYFSSSNPIFSPGGKFLFFKSDRTYRATVSNVEWNYAYKDMTKIYGITLSKNIRSPFDIKETKSNDKKKSNSKKKEIDKEEKADKNEVENVDIDFDGISDRIFEFPVDAADYYRLYAHPSHKLFYIKNTPGSKPALYVFDAKKKEEQEIAPMRNYDVSFDGEHIIYKNAGSFYVSKLGEKLKPKPEDKLETDQMEKLIDHKTEWKQIFYEAWRQMRDFFYDPGMHGLNWEQIKEKYSQLLPYVDNRVDLTYIIGEMIAELNVGHAYVGGGDKEKEEQVGIGLLGAEYEYDTEEATYRISKIFEGRNWDEDTRSPLTEPGIHIEEGDYLLSIDGVNLTREITPFVALNSKVAQYIEIEVKKAAGGKKTYKVKTIKSEKGLRYFDWVESNRMKVDKATNNRVGYIHIPDMAVGNGLNEFVKYFYPQLNKEALIIDDRYNGGGNVSPMIIERLRREVAVAKHARNQNVVTSTPGAVMTGPLVCLINELSASDGDLFPYQFKQYNLGKLIGKRSWGGVIGIRGSLPFVDGSYLYKPEFANFGADGTWVLEGIGMKPDIEVDNHPYEELIGNDQQLNRAIEEILKDIQTNKKPQIPEVPKFPIKN